MKRIKKVKDVSFAFLHSSCFLSVFTYLLLQRASSPSDGNF